MVNDDLCRGSCGRARAGGAEPFATTTRVGRPPSRRAPAVRCTMQRQRVCLCRHRPAAACVPMSPPASQPSLGETGDEPPGMRRRLRSQSSCPTPVRRDHRRRSCGGALAAHRALVHGDAQPAPSGRSTRALRAGLRHRLTIRHGHRSGTARGPFLGTGRCPVSGERLAARPTRPADPPKPAGRPPKTGWPTPQIRPADRPNLWGPLLEGVFSSQRYLSL